MDDMRRVLVLGEARTSIHRCTWPRKSGQEETIGWNSLDYMSVKKMSEQTMIPCLPKTRI